MTWKLCHISCLKPSHYTTAIPNKDVTIIILQWLVSYSRLFLLRQILFWHSFTYICDRCKLITAKAYNFNLVSTWKSNNLLAWSISLMNLDLTEDYFLSYRNIPSLNSNKSRRLDYSNFLKLVHYLCSQLLQNEV